MTEKNVQNTCSPDHATSRRDAAQRSSTTSRGDITSGDEGIYLRQRHTPYCYCRTEPKERPGTRNPKKNGPGQEHRCGASTRQTGREREISRGKISFGRFDARHQVVGGDAFYAHGRLTHHCKRKGRRRRNSRTPNDFKLPHGDFYACMCAHKRRDGVRRVQRSPARPG